MQSLTESMDNRIQKLYITLIYASGISLLQYKKHETNNP